MDVRGWLGVCVALASCGGGARHTARGEAAAPETAPSVTRVTILPDPLGAEGELPRPTFLGVDDTNHEVWALNGLRLASGPAGVDVARRGLPGDIRAASVDASGVWVFLLADGSLWRAADALGTPELLGPLSSDASRTPAVPRALVGAQRGRLAVAYRGYGFVLEGEPPAGRLDSLPPGTVESIAAVGEHRLLARLVGGRTFAAEGDDAQWTPVASPEDEWPDGLRRPPPAPAALLRAIVRAHPTLARSLGVPLRRGGSVVASAMGPPLHLRADGGVDLVEIAWRDSFVLGALDGRAVVDEGGSVMVSEDGRAFTRIEDAWLGDSALRCESGSDAHCLVASDGRRHEVDLGEADGLVTSRWIVVADESGTRVHARAAEGLGEPVAVLPATGLERVSVRGDAVLAGRTLWTPRLGVTEVPADTHSAATFGDGAALAWGANASTLRIHRGDGGWEPIGVDAPPVQLFPGGRCEGSRCTLRGPGVLVAIDVGEQIAPLGEHVIRLEDHAYERPRRVPNIRRRGVVPFGAITLSCSSRPASAPTSGAGLRELTLTGPSMSWRAHRARPTRAHTGQPDPVLAAVGDALHALAWVGDTLLDASEGHVPIQRRDHVQGFDAFPLGSERWLVVAARRAEGRYARWQPTESRRFVDLARFESRRGCYGLARRGGEWGALICGEDGRHAAWLDFDEPRLPEVVDLAAIEHEAAAPPPVCAVEPRDLARVAIDVDWDERSGVAIAVLGIDDAPCVWQLELRREAPLGEWSAPGILEAYGGTLRGVVRVTDAWETRACRPVARRDD